MDELDLELERDKQRPVEIVKKGGWLGRIVALLLGIVIGFVGCFGAIAAVVYYFFGVMKIEEGANYLKGVVGDDFEYTDYIAEEYGDKTTLELILSTANAAPAGTLVASAAWIIIEPNFRISSFKSPHAFAYTSLLFKELEHTNSP